MSLPGLSIYNLTDKLEKENNVALVYRNSLLYLVSRALERQSKKPVPGMQRNIQKNMKSYPGLSVN